jgi:hypothetical protein
MISEIFLRGALIAVTIWATTFGNADGQEARAGTAALPTLEPLKTSNRKPTDEISKDCPAHRSQPLRCVELAMH